MPFSKRFIKSESYAVDSIGWILDREKANAIGGGCPPALLEGEKNKRFLYSVKPLALLGEEVGALGFEPVPEFLPPAKFKSDNKLVHRHRIATRLMILGIF